MATRPARRGTGGGRSQNPGGRPPDDRQHATDGTSPSSSRLTPEIFFFYFSFFSLCLATVGDIPALGTGDLVEGYDLR